MMTIFRKRLRLLASIMLLSIVLPWASALADEGEGSGSAIQQQHAIDYVVANRDAFIAELVNQWKPAVLALKYDVAVWEQEFVAALSKTAPRTLLAIQTASNYDAVRAIFQGRPAPVAVQKGLGVQDLGDLTTDLTFTPNNPPCRIIDTRNYGGGTIVPGGTTRSFYVHSTGGSQGGGNCPAPKGEPVGVAMNLAAVSPQAAGHLRVWPYGAAMPTVSYLNFSAGQNIANAGIISTCYTCGYDLSIYNGSTTHYIADIMGYFYPAKIGKAIEIQQSEWSALYVDVMYLDQFLSTDQGGSPQFFFAGGEEVMWEFSGAVNAIYDPAYPNNQSIYGVWVAAFRQYEGGVTLAGCNRSFSFSMSPYTNFVSTSCKTTIDSPGAYSFGIVPQAGGSTWEYPAYVINSPQIKVWVINRQ